MRNDQLGANIDQDAFCHRCNHCHAPHIPCHEAHCAPRCNVCGRAQGACSCAQAQARTCQDAPRNACQNNCPNNCPNNRQNNCHQSCGDQRSPGMVYAQKHTLDHIYNANQALIRGTLFPCLDKPMGCMEPCNPCLTKAQALNFAAWEVRLYLNTHPHDEEALALFRSLCQQMDQPGYANAFIDHGCTWRWPDDPWPWEYSTCCGKEG